MRQSSNQILMNAVRRVQDSHPGYIETVLNRRNNPDGEGGRWYRPQTLESLTSRRWIHYSDPEGLLALRQAVPGCVALVTAVPGFVGIEPLEQLPPETELQLYGSNTERYRIGKILYPVLNGMPKLSASFTLALLEPASKIWRVEDDPLLSTFVIGRPVPPSCTAVHEDLARGIIDGAVMTVMELLGRGVTHYKMGAMPKRPMLFNSEGYGNVYEGVVRANVEMVTEPLRVVAKSRDDAEDKLIQIASYAGTTWQYEVQNGQCPVFPHFSPRPYVRIGDVQLRESLSTKRVQITFFDTRTQPGAVQRNVNYGTVSDPDR